MRPRLVLLTFLTGVLVVVGAALATPGAGVNATVHARGAIQDPASVHRAGIELLKMGWRREGIDIATQSITLAPGGTTGWHGHPGPVFVTVKSGELTVVYANDRSCEGTTYTAGQSFIDFGNVTVHTALNRAAGPVDFWATYVVPGAPGTPFRIDAPASEHCGF
jgi:hypothetical protein